MRRLTRGQVAAILTCLVPLYALVAWDAWERHAGPPTRGTGWVLTHDVPAGARIGSGDLAPLPLTYGADSFAYLTDAPVDRVAGVALHHGVLLAPDDVLPETAATAEVAIQVSAPPPLSVGALIDVYIATGSDFRRVGAHVPVVAVSPLTIRVPARDAAAWLALSAGHQQLLVAVTGDVTATGVSVIEPCAAIAQLSGAPCPPGRQ